MEKRCGKLWLVCVLFFTLLINGCAPVQKAQNSANAPLFSAKNDKAGSIIVISDMHLGVDDSFSKLQKNRPLLVDFIHRVGRTPGIAEVVIAGDFLDEWAIPCSYPSHTDSSVFYKQVAENNKDVISALQALMTTYGKKLTYVPGNHDLLLDEATLEEILPGINQSREGNGLGVYKTGPRNEIAIEHGHRYDVLCAPDSLSNKLITGDYPSILPVGYFFARIGNSATRDGVPLVNKATPVLQAPSKINEDAYGAYMYYRTWLSALEVMPLKSSMDEGILLLQIDGYDNVFSVADLFPARTSKGKIDAALFGGIQNRWLELQKLNHIITPSTFIEAIPTTDATDYVDDYAKKQYFDHDPSIEVVVFGHTHAAMLKEYKDPQGNSKIYANSGTWSDTNKYGETTTFVRVTPGATTDTAEVFKFHEDGSVTQL